MSCSNKDFTISILHLGAGLHSSYRIKDYRQLCIFSLQSTDHSFDAVDKVEQIINKLEDSPLVNCAFGSQLTIDGKVECDASICDSRGGYASIAAASGIRYPITVAKLLMENGKLVGPFGRIPPLILCGSGVNAWCERIERLDLLLDAETMVTERRYQQMEKYKNIMISINNDPEKDYYLDTVGALSIDKHGVLAAGVSSGGILCKDSGRIGHAGVYNAGCMAFENDKVSIGISVSGTGEQIIKTQFTVRLMDEIVKHYSTVPLSEIVSETLEERFLKHKMLEMYANKFIGIIALIVFRINSESRRAEMVYAHTTPTMVIAYKVDNKRNKFLFSEKKPEKCFKVELVMLK